MDNESKKSVPDKIIENAPLALTILGVVLVLIGAAGGIKFQQLQIPVIDSYGRVTLGLIGLLVVLFGILLIWRERTRESIVKRPQNDYEKDLGTGYGIKITSPKRNDRVSERFDVEGIYKTKPTDENSIWIIEYRSDTHEFWPKRPVVFDPDNTWHLTITVGGRHMQKLEIMVADVGQSGQALLNYSLKVGKESNRWISIEKLTPDITRLDSVTIIRERVPTS
jgi:hypothetical protein